MKSIISLLTVCLMLTPHARADDDVNEKNGAVPKDQEYAQPVTPEAFCSDLCPSKNAVASKLNNPEFPRNEHQAELPDNGKSPGTKPDGTTE